ncbi:MAG: ATP-binding protein [Proteobacteria bacterium]|nr:ATP-binding protein [Cystobacterineae bacterium]MCL2259532.1 ATP-binding protein [Cystobacterineae bacterium]MCL2313993.1 ATP-binding protein [Pseudomonadota bacterium]
MERTTKPPNEASRLRSMERLLPADFFPRNLLQKTLKMTCKLTGFPMAAVSVVGENKQRFVAAIGIAECEFERENSVCAKAILNTQPTLIPDLSVDVRYAQLTFTKATKMKAYAGIPLRTKQGEAIGMLCLLDLQPRLLPPHLVLALSNMVEILMEALEDRLYARAPVSSTEDDSFLLAVLNSLTDVVLTVDASGAISSANHTVEKLFGIDCTQVIGQPITRFLPNLFSGGASSIHDPYATSNLLAILETMEMTAKKASGELITVDVRAGRLLRRGTRTFTLMVRDASERKRIEKMKDEFIATISHELRTPLTVLRGALTLFDAGLPEAEMKELLGIAQENTDRLVRLVNDILEIERLETGHIQLRPKLEPVAKLVEGILILLRPMATARKVKLLAQHAIEGISVWCDKDRIVQTLTNLVANAISFAPPDSAVCVSTALTLKADLRFEVADKGPGIASEQIGKLFQRFSQLGNRNAKTGGGAGLGLAIARAIVELHGGRIGVESAPGEGSHFWFELPGPLSFA